jgi:hypothetical protein
VWRRRLADCNFGPAENYFASICPGTWSISSSVWESQVACCENIDFALTSKVDNLLQLIPRNCTKEPPQTRAHRMMNQAKIFLFIPRRSDAEKGQGVVLALVTIGSSCRASNPEKTRIGHCSILCIDQRRRCGSIQSNRLLHTDHIFYVFQAAFELYVDTRHTINDLQT